MAKVIIKFVFAAGLVVWLIKSGKLDFSLIAKSLSQSNAWLWCLLLIVVQDVISAFRWYIILKVKTTKKIPISKIISVTWIGLFFNSLLPGAVTGDLIKLVYARDLDEDMSKTFLVASVLLDRVFGLIGLLLILGISSIIYYREIISIGPAIESLMHFNFTLLALACCFLVCLFVHSKLQQKILNITDRVPIIGQRISKAFRQVWLIGGDKKAIGKCLLISTFAQLLSFVGFYIISSPFYGVDMPLPYVFTFIPLGFVAIAIPISPAGLGVGHAVFEKLFSLAGISGGASLFNLYFLCLVFINMLGFAPYMIARKTERTNT